MTVLYTFLCLLFCSSYSLFWLFKNVLFVFKSLNRLYGYSSATPVGWANEILVEQKSADGLWKGWKALAYEVSVYNLVDKNFTITHWNKWLVYTWKTPWYQCRWTDILNIAYPPTHWRAVCQQSVDHPTAFACDVIMALYAGDVSR